MSHRRNKEIEKYNYFASIDDYKKAFEDFKSSNGHYPSSKEIDTCPYLPTSRTIQRKFFSLKLLRTQIGLTGIEIDKRKGFQTYDQ